MSRLNGLRNRRGQVVLLSLAIAAGAVWAGGMVVAYTVRDSSVPSHEFSTWLMRFVP